MSDGVDRETLSVAGGAVVPSGAPRHAAETADRP